MAVCLWRVPCSMIYCHPSVKLPETHILTKGWRYSPRTQLLHTSCTATCIHSSSMWSLMHICLLQGKTQARQKEKRHTHTHRTRMPRRLGSSGCHGASQLEGVWVGVGEEVCRFLSWLGQKRTGQTCISAMPKYGRHGAPKQRKHENKSAKTNIKTQSWEQEGEKAQGSRRSIMGRSGTHAFLVLDVCRTNGSQTSLFRWA